MGKVLSIIIWPFAFVLDLLTLGLHHPILTRLDKWQCGVMGHGEGYKKSGCCELCGHISPSLPAPKEPSKPNVRTTGL